MAIRPRLPGQFQFTSIIPASLLITPSLLSYVTHLDDTLYGLPPTSLTSYRNAVVLQDVLENADQYKFR